MGAFYSLIMKVGLEVNAEKTKCVYVYIYIYIRVL